MYCMYASLIGCGRRLLTCASPKDVTPAETINLMNCTVSAVDDHVEVVETVPGRIRDKATRKIVLKVDDEATIWENVLQRRPQDEKASDGLKAMLSV